MKYKFKRKIKNTFAFIKTITTFPHFWVSVIIIILALIAILLSKRFYISGDTFKSSVFSNIFTGLITGLIITILLGIKNTYTAILQGKCIWLTETHNLILTFLSLKRELYGLNDMTSEVFFNKAYDAGSAANYVNDRILQSTFDKVKWFNPSEYFKTHYKYRALEVAEDMESLHVFISNNGEEAIYRKDIMDRLKLVLM